MPPRPESGVLSDPDRHGATGSAKSAASSKSFRLQPSAGIALLRAAMHGIDNKIHGGEAA